MSNPFPPTTSYTVNALNELFTPLGFRERLQVLKNYFNNEEVLYTSSFGTKSVFLLHLIHQHRPAQKVHFIDTTYHFPETIAYRDQLVELLHIDLINIRPQLAENKITQEEAWWKNHPRMCCSINKIAPLDPIVAQHKIWISGLMAHQTDFRARLRVFEQQGDIIKFHPLIDVDPGEFLFHIDKYKLPKHPLEAAGYGSIGCTHCTFKGEGRSGRWKGSTQSECGLHPNFFKKKVRKNS